MELYQNLCPHESVLLSLGIILFAVLVFLLIWKTVKERKIAVLLPFFLLPIIMIAYPTIGSVQYSEGKIEFSTLLTQFMQGSASTDNVEDFEKVYDMIINSCRVQHDPEMQTQLARANLAAGNFERAAAITEQTLSRYPGNASATEVMQLSREQMRLEAEFNEKVSRLEAIINTYEEGSIQDARALQALNRTLSDIQLPQNIEPSSAMIVAKSLAYIGERDNALALVNQILNYPGIQESESSHARQLRSGIRNNRFIISETELQESEPVHMVINPNLTPENLSAQRLKTVVFSHREQ